MFLLWSSIQLLKQDIEDLQSLLPGETSTTFKYIMSTVFFVCEMRNFLG